MAAGETPATAMPHFGFWVQDLQTDARLASATCSEHSSAAACCCAAAVLLPFSR